MCAATERSSINSTLREEPRRAHCLVIAEANAGEISVTHALSRRAAGANETHAPPRHTPAKGLEVRGWITTRITIGAGAGCKS